MSVETTINFVQNQEPLKTENRLDVNEKFIVNIYNSPTRCWESDFVSYRVSCGVSGTCGSNAT